MDESVTRTIIEILLGAFVALQGYFLRRMWNEKPDRIEVITLIQEAIDTWKELDKELDEGRLGIIVAKMDEREIKATERHVQNLRRFEGLDAGINQLLGRGVGK